MPKTLFLYGTVTVAGPCIVPAAIAVLFNAVGLEHVAVIFSCCAFVLFYRKAMRSYHYVWWRGNPVRIYAILLLLSQLLFWVWYIIPDQLKPGQSSWWLFGDFSRSEISSACAHHLLSQFVFLICLDAGYRFGIAKQQPLVRQLKVGRMALAAAIVMAASLVYIFLCLMLRVQSTVVNYLGTAVLRVFPLMVAISTYVIMVSKRKSERLGFGALLAASLGCGLLITQMSGMRFVVLTQLLVLFCVLFSLAKLNARYVTAVACLLITAFIVNTGISMSKFERDDVETTSERVRFGLDSTIHRMGAFITEVELLRDPSVRRVVADHPLETLRRFVGGLPFAAVFLPASDENATSLNMELYWAISGNLHGISSLAITGLTEIRIAYGLIVMLIAAMLVGWLQGWTAAVSWRIAGSFQWLIIVSAYSLPAIVGMQVHNMLDLPLIVLCGSLLIRVITKSPGDRRQSGAGGTNGQPLEIATCARIHA